MWTAHFAETSPHTLEWPEGNPEILCKVMYKTQALDAKTLA